MKNIIKILLLLITINTAQAQFRRSSDSNAYPFSATLPNNYLLLLSRPGVTNYNYAASNLWISVTNIANGAASNATNGFLTTVSNISSTVTNGIFTTVSNIANFAVTNLAIIPTNTTQLPGVVTDSGRGIGTNVTTLATITALSNYVYSVTNNLAPTNSGLAGQVLHTSATGGPTRWDYVNQALTNSDPVRPNFNLPVNYFQTNAAFVFLAPSNVETTGKKLQVTDVIVTNSTAAAVAVTFPSGVTPTGTAFVTNLTVFHFRQFATLWTNCACEPIR